MNKASETVKEKIAVKGIKVSSIDLTVEDWAILYIKSAIGLIVAAIAFGLIGLILALILKGVGIFNDGIMSAILG